MIKVSKESKIEMNKVKKIAQKMKVVRCGACGDVLPFEIPAQEQCCKCQDPVEETP